MPSTFNNPSLFKIISGVANDPFMPPMGIDSYFNVYLFSSSPGDLEEFYAPGPLAVSGPESLPGYIDIVNDNPIVFNPGVPGYLYNNEVILWTNPTLVDVTITHLLLERSDSFGANSSTWILLALETPFVVPTGNIIPFIKYPTQVSFKVSNP